MSRGGRKKSLRNRQQPQRGGTRYPGSQGRTHVPEKQGGADIPVCPAPKGDVSLIPRPCTTALEGPAPSGPSAPASRNGHDANARVRRVTVHPRRPPRPGRCPRAELWRPFRPYQPHSLPRKRQRRATRYPGSQGRTHVPEKQGGADIPVCPAPKGDVSLIPRPCTTALEGPAPSGPSAPASRNGHDANARVRRVTVHPRLPSLARGVARWLSYGGPSGLTMARWRDFPAEARRDAPACHAGSAAIFRREGRRAAKSAAPKTQRTPLAITATGAVNSFAEVPA